MNRSITFLVEVIRKIIDNYIIVNQISTTNKKMSKKQVVVPINKIVITYDDEHVQHFKNNKSLVTAALDEFYDAMEARDLSLDNKYVPDFKYDYEEDGIYVIEKKENFIKE
tara:strand:+ start:44 stop:376 length:333 start_codon:yes stop_codon:yes gene_type:complete